MDIETLLNDAQPIEDGEMTELALDLVDISEECATGDHIVSLMGDIEMIAETINEHGVSNTAKHIANKCAGLGKQCPSIVEGKKEESLDELREAMFFSCEALGEAHKNQYKLMTRAASVLKRLKEVSTPVKVKTTKSVSDNITIVTAMTSMPIGNGSKEDLLKLGKWCLANSGKMITNQVKLEINGTMSVHNSPVPSGDVDIKEVIGYLSDSIKGYEIQTKADGISKVRATMKEITDKHERATIGFGIRCFSSITQAARKAIVGVTKLALDMIRQDTKNKAAK